VGLNYSTNFPLTENPISESGNWQTTTTGTFNNPVSTTSGHAVGLTSSGTNDSVACLVGSYLRDQTVTCTVYRGGTSGAAEVEIHLRCQILTNQVKTYEIDFVPSGDAVAIVKWNGDQGDITELIQTGSLGGLSDGDVLKASCIGPANSTVITVYKNDVQILQTTDTSAYVIGNPGMGFDAGTSPNGANLGFKSFSAVTV
jgi:hypothetical protein